MKYTMKLLFSLFLLSIACSLQNDNKKYDKVEQGRFRSTFTETGVLEVVNSIPVLPPSGKVISLIKEGTIVKKGDIVAELDKANFTRNFIQKKQELEIEKSSLEKLKVNHQIQLRQLNEALKTKEAELRSAELRIKQDEFEIERKKRISQINLQIVEIGLQATKRRIETTKLIQAEEIRIKETKIQQIIPDISEAERLIESSSLRAPIDGMAVIGTHIHSVVKYKVGDNVRFDTPIITFPDLSAMKAMSTVTERDIGKIHLGQKVFVRLDAFPDKTFNGSISYISLVPGVSIDPNFPGKFPGKGDKDKKSYIIEILIDETDKLLKPGLTVNCEYVIADLDNALYVDSEYISEEDSGYYVYTDTKRVKVKLGPRNNTDVVIYGNIEAGERILLKDKDR